MKQTLLSGEDSLRKLENFLERKAPSKILLVRGKDSYEKCGAGKSFSEIFERLNARVDEFKDFSVNPNIEDALKGLELIKNLKPEVIIAVGGGSVMDMAKTLRFLDAYEGSVEEEKYVKKGDLIPLIAVPTTSGTGSEATRFAILYKNKIKYSVDHPDVLPDVVVLHPEFTAANPSYLTACCGFDAMAQSIEALWNRYSIPEADEYAKRALELIAPNLEEVVKNPTPELRQKLQEGAYWAGRAINLTRTTAPHAFSYVFTSYYGYPHGHAVALTFPAIAQINLTSDKVDDAKKEFILKTCGIEAGHIKEGFKAFVDSIGLGVKDLGYDKSLILKNINPGRLKNNPVDISLEMASEIIDF